jgi:heme-degrading monooxygenase HmoA
VYVNVFRSRKRASFDAEAYAADVARMEALARTQKGFIAYRRYMASDGESLSMTEWETEADAHAWGRHPEHVAVQAKGRAEYYESYAVYACVDPQVRRFARAEL